METLTPVFAIDLILALVIATAWHEMGHLLMARKLGLPVKLITFGFGPVLWRSALEDETQFVLRALPTGISIGVPARHSPDGTLRRPLHHDLLVALGGPLASLLLTALAVVALVIFSLDGGLQNFMIGTGLLSILLMLLNLLPIPGLDGGHIFMLSAIWLGLPITPTREQHAHRTGLRLLSTLSAMLTVFLLLGKIV